MMPTPGIVSSRWLACVLPVPRHQLAFDLADLFGQGLKLRGQRQKRRPSESRQVQPVVGIAQAPDEVGNLPWLPAR